MKFEPIEFSWMHVNGKQRILASIAYLVCDHELKDHLELVVDQRNVEMYDPCWRVSERITGLGVPSFARTSRKTAVEAAVLLLKSKGMDATKRILYAELERRERAL